MKTRRFLVPMRVLALATACLSLIWGMDQGFAQSPGAAKDAASATKSKMRSITPAQREEAARRAATQRAAVAAPTKAAVATRAAALSRIAALATPTPGGTPDYFGNVPNYANSPLPVVDPATGKISGGIRKFVDTLPGLGAANANNLGQYIPVAMPIKNPNGTDVYPGSDYYEIALVEYTQQMHSDLPPTKLRGYKDLNPSADGNAHYLGPVIQAQRDRPVRIKFTNQLPTGAGGDLFIPTDTTYMGAGMGPVQMKDANGNPMFNPDGTPMMEPYTQNRATLHLHGGTTPWISDGTPHQWTTPAGETTSYPKGVSVRNVPDMPDPGPGSLTFFYSNQQSARLMFYHDHAYGITRLNVYAGEAAGYLLQDLVEQALVSGGVIPADQIPLIIQDKTFVPDNTKPFTNLAGSFACQLAAQDPTWDTTKWGGFGQLWFPHVYMTNQDPYDVSGANAMGRWDYGPWFWPPFTGIQHGPVSNPYYDPVNAPWEPPMIPGTPSLTGVPESFMDTPVINGTAYPVLKVDPKAYRLRILNACNDRYVNLQLYKAKSQVAMWNLDGPNGAPGTLNDANAGEVNMVAYLGSTVAWPTNWPGNDGRTLWPDPAAVGPNMIQIGTEGGFLPAPATIPNRPIGYNLNKRDITVGNVQEKALFLGPAERADVVLDFSQFAGQTLILYNDAPAPVPAADPRLDYYTGDPDQSNTGGAPSTLPGYGPNIRTIVQIQVAAARADGKPIVAYDPTSLNAQLPGAFAASQDTILVPQAPYSTVYNATFPGDVSAYVKIQDTSFNFTPIAKTGGTLTGFTINSGGSGYSSSPTVTITSGGGTGAAAQAVVTGGVITGFAITSPGSGYYYPPVVTITDPTGKGAIVAATLSSTTSLTMPLQPKAIIEDFQMDYGRMNALLGVEIPHTNMTNQTSIIQAYIDPPTEVVKFSASATPIGALADGTQIWKITHNGVDTHAVHFHMFNVQIVNRVGWDGMLKPPDANELGWKDTIRANPLEDVIVALRPISLTNVPFPLPNSVRPLDVTQPLGSTMGFTNVNPAGTPVTVTNQPVNFGWEYVWHCHLLGHEENDMMRPMAFAVAPDAPVLTAKVVSPSRIDLSWTETSINQTSFTLQRAGDSAFMTGVTTWTFGPTAAAYSDTSVQAGTPYYYRLLASNLVGSSVTGYPQVSADSAWSNIANPTTIVPPIPLTGLTAAAADPHTINLAWTNTNTAASATGVQIWRANGGAAALLQTVAATATTFSDTPLLDGTTYSYYVVAVNGSLSAAASNTATATTPLAPPTNLVATASAPGVNPPTVSLTWANNSVSATGCTIQWAVDAAFTAPLAYNVGANATTYTDTLPGPGTYYYRAAAVQGTTTSAWSNTATVTIASPGLAIDATVWGDQGPASTTVRTSAFSTTAGNELLLAFVATDYLSGTNTRVTGITGGGLTWVLVRRTNVQSGTAEIWRAFAPNPLTNVRVTATLSQSVASSLTVVSFRGASPSGTNGSGAIGATGSGNAARGAPRASLTTTRNNSWVFGVGNDYDQPIARTVGPNQTMIHQNFSPTGDTYWVQRQNAPTPTAGTVVTINDTAPTGDRYNLTIVEVLPAP